MLPTLFNIGDFPVHAYGVLIAIGFLLTVWVAKRDAEKMGMPGDKIVDLGFWSLLVGMVGARILYVFTRFDYYTAHPLEMFYVWEGGLVFFGGPLLCIPFFIWYTKKHNLPRWKVLDIAAVGVPLAHAFGRLGCLSAGCCYGKPTGGNWGIKLYSDLVEPHMQGVYLHPTQIYESVSMLLLFFALRRLEFRRKFEGQVMFVYLIAYSIIRSIIEIFRGDSIRGFVIDDVLSTSQFISIIVIAFSIVFYIKRSRQAACLTNPASA